MAKSFALVIDDNEELGSAFSQALRLYDFDVELVRDGAYALERIDACLPDIITLDMQMPHLTGDKILRAIRSNPRYAMIKIIVVTANAYASQDAMINELADLVLIKPVSIDQIVEFTTRLTQSTL